MEKATTLAYGEAFGKYALQIPDGLMVENSV
jgi:hypothetical protein